MIIEPVSALCKKMSKNSEILPRQQAAQISRRGGRRPGPPSPFRRWLKARNSLFYAGCLQTPINLLFSIYG
jgi:hypothetical protein